MVVAPPGAKECALLLARAANAEQRAAVGKQTGGRVGFFLFTDNLARDYARYRERGVNFIRPVTTHDYGSVAVFEDLHGNLWDLLEPSNSAGGGGGGGVSSSSPETNLERCYHTRPGGREPSTHYFNPR